MPGLDLHTTKKDYAMLVAALLLLLAIGFVVLRLAGAAVLIVVPSLAAVLVLGLLLEVYRRLSEEARVFQERHDEQQLQHYRQIEALFSLFFTIKPSLPLPEMRAWAGSPDLLKKIAEVVLMDRPALVVEASSGVSTLVIAYCLKQLGRGKVVSLEHDAKYAAASERLVAFHGLQDIATIVHAPLKEVEIADRTWLWYDSDRLRMDAPIDLLVVDGPPDAIQPLARYPAVPLLNNQFRTGSKVILDDSHRGDETEIVARWVREFGLSAESFAMEKGACVLTKLDR
jgi:hypothetical protein